MPELRAEARGVMRTGMSMSTRCAILIVRPRDARKHYGSANCDGCGAKRRRICSEQCPRRLVRELQEAGGHAVFWPRKGAGA